MLIHSSGEDHRLWRARGALADLGSSVPHALVAIVRSQHDSADLLYFALKKHEQHRGVRSEPPALQQSVTNQSRAHLI